MIKAPSITGLKIKKLSAINPEWIPQSTMKKIVEIDADKIGKGEIYFSIVIGGKIQQLKFFSIC